jgi:hypothetical protein
MEWSPRVDVGVFEQAQIPEDLGITAELLADAHNLASCFGAESKDEKVKRFVFKTRTETITITVSTEDGNHGMVFIIGDMMAPNPVVINCGNGGDGMPCNAYLDKRLNAAVLQHVITTADKQAEEKGGIKDGQRVDLCISAKAPVMKVDVIFHEPGACIPIIPQEGDTQESLMERAKKTVVAFDKPGELAIMSHPISGISVIRKSHLDYIKKREEIAHELLKEHGFNPRDLSGITPEVFNAIKEQIEERCKAFREEYLSDRERILPLPDKLQQD